VDQDWVPVTTGDISSDEEVPEPVAGPSHIWEHSGGQDQGGQSSSDDDTELPEVPELRETSPGPRAKKSKRVVTERKVWKWKRGDLDPQDILTCDIKPCIPMV